MRILVYKYILLICTAGICPGSKARTVNRQTPAIDVKHISLQIKFDWKKKQAYGTAAIKFSTLQSTSLIHLDAGCLTIHSIKLADSTALTFSYDGGDTDDGLHINLNRKYPPSEEIVIFINYHTNHINQPDPNFPGGSFGKGLRFFSPTAVNPTRRKQVWSQGEVENNKYWFPCNESPDDLRTTELTATVDSNLTVISNGILLSDKKNADGTRTFHYHAATPYPNYLTSVVAGEYVSSIKSLNGLPLQTFCYPDEAEAAKASTVRLPGMVKFFTEQTGVAYPYKTYSQVMVQDYPFPGQTGQHMATIISDNFVDDYGTHADFLYLWDGVESNALAAQWFGNMITAKDWKHNWLMKSFAQYMEGLYTASGNGEDEYLLWYHPFEMSTVMGDWQAGYRHALVPDTIENNEQFVTDNYAKFRGALVLRMLSKQIGERKWRQAIKYFVQQYKNKQVTTEDFQKVVETVSGSNLNWFFDQWVYKTGHPVFEVTKAYDGRKKQLQLLIKQVQKPDSAAGCPQVDYFHGKMEIAIDNRIYPVWVEPKEENKFSFFLAKEPKLIQPDFQSYWIKEINFTKSTAELLYQLLNDKDVLGRQRAMTELVQKAKDTSTGIADKKSVIAALQTLIKSKQYWRIRLAAVSQLRNIQEVTYESETRQLLLTVIKNEKSWLRAAAITSLGMTKDPAYAPLYISYFNDTSDRVINAAAIALGKTKTITAFEALLKLKDKPSWKSQSLMHALSGMAQLGDERGVAIALDALKDNTSPRWFLSNGWDYPFVAMQTLITLGKAASAYPILEKNVLQALKENEWSDLFQNLPLLVMTGDKRGLDIINRVKESFKGNDNAMTALNNLESQLKN